MKTETRKKELYLYTDLLEENEAAVKLISNKSTLADTPFYKVSSLVRWVEQQELKEGA
jgi:hypothetical protein